VPEAVDVAKETYGLEGVASKVDLKAIPPKLLFFAGRSVT
jgi:hypothetical protein